MIWIRQWLALGSLRDTRNPSLLAVERISAILQLAAPVADPARVTLYLPMDDGIVPDPELWARGSAFVRAQHAAGGRVLIACHWAVSRSPAMALAALTELEGGSLVELLRAIRAVHPAALPEPGLWASLNSYLGRDEALLDVFRHQP